MSPADAFYPGYLVVVEKRKNLFRTFFEGDWKLQRKLLRSRLQGGVDADVEDPGEEDDVFGDLPSEDVHGEAGDVQLGLAFYSLQ